MTRFQISGEPPIDVAIPCAEKDVTLLPRAIDGVRRNVLDRIGRIIVVAAESTKIRSVCHRLDCEFILEDVAAPLPRRDVNCVVNGDDRSGWIFQQLIKLSVDRVSTADHILVLDADTILTRPHVFRRSGRTVFFVNTKCHDPYFDAYARLLELPRFRAESFIAHYMLMDRHKLAALRDAIEAATKRTWYGAILATADGAASTSFFSEYETYGNFCLFNVAEDFLLEPADNLTLPPSWIALLPLMAMAGKQRSVSLHHHAEHENRRTVLTSILRAFVSR